mgnify:CR=1 FL=1
MKIILDIFPTCANLHSIMAKPMSKTELAEKVIGSAPFEVTTRKEQLQVLDIARTLRIAGKLDFDVTSRKNKGRIGWTILRLPE